MSNDRDDRDDRDIDLLNTAAQVLGSLGQGPPRIQFGDNQPEYTLEQLEEIYSGDFVAEDLIAELHAEIEELEAALEFSAESAKAFRAECDALREVLRGHLDRAIRLLLVQEEPGDLHVRSELVGDEVGAVAEALLVARAALDGGEE
jgi:hypothetical protein